MKQLPASCFSLCGLGSNKNSSTYFGNREDCTELIILVNALEFYLEHWAKVVACFGIDLIKVLFKDFLGKLVKSVWEPMIWRELVKDILLFSFHFLLLFLQAFRLLFPLNSNHKTHSLKMAVMPLSEEDCPRERQWCLYLHIAGRWTVGKEHSLH